MNDVTIIDQFLNTFAAYIDSGFGLLRGEVAFLTATLIVIDMTIAGLYWAMSHATGQGEDVIAKLLRKVLYVGAFAYIINNFNWLASIVFRSFAGLGITATGSAITMENFLQPGRLAKTGIDAGAPILEQIGEMAGFPEVFVNLDPIVVMFLAWLVVVLCFFVLAIQLFITLIEFKLTTLAGFVTGELGDRLAVHRRGVGEVQALDRRHELAADVVAVAGLEGNDGAFATGMGVTHDGISWLLCLLGEDALSRLS